MARFPESLETPVISGQDFIPNMEVLAVDPDVGCRADMADEVLQPIEQAPVVGLEYGTQDLETWIDLFGDMIGAETRRRN